jgi:caa(3)-type oxidase subunit IV
MAHHDTHATALPHAHGAGHAHGPQHYVKIWAILCVLLVISVVGPMLEIRLVTLITAFGIAIVKAFMVAKYFMHLGIEKRWVTYILVGMIAFMVVFFGGVAPDVLPDDGQQWHKTYEEPALHAPGEGAGH